MVVVKVTMIKEVKNWGETRVFAESTDGVKGTSENN